MAIGGLGGRRMNTGGRIFYSGDSIRRILIFGGLCGERGAKKEVDTRKRRKLRRKRILYIYKEHYCRPFWTAIKQSSGNVQELNQRISAFTLGVCIADPYGHWHKTFNNACDEVMKEILDDGMEVR